MQRFAASTIADEVREAFANDVREGLSRTDQKRLNSKHLYDSVGSALFEVITRLPEYGLARADERVLRQLAPELPPLLGGNVRVGELGSGSGTKTRFILEALKPSNYHPIDVSGSALAACCVELGGLSSIHPHEGAYLEGLREVRLRRGAHERLLLLFLGSTIGNFTLEEALDFLCELRSLLHAGDALLLGADLVKPVETLLLAYDDPAGVTAAFNKNLLGRMNRELGANFDLKAFAHEACYESHNHAVEMHLRSLRAQVVDIPEAGLRVEFRQGESIWTESSRKFTVAELDELARASGFEPCRRWVDPEWPFAECLWLAP